MANLCDGTECQRLADNAWDVWKGLDLCVNNAGADTLTGQAAHWPFERKLEALLAVDVTATMLLSRALGQCMKEAGGGVVINMGWDQADVGMEGDSGELFAAAKGAVMAFSKSLALSLAPEVRVHCLAPGWIRTSWGEGASKAWQDRVLRETPLRQWGLPEDVAATVRWLASPAARYLTGQAIRVNGARCVEKGSALRVEAVGESAAVDVEGFEDSQDGINGHSPVLRPADDVEVFLAGFEAVEDAVEEEGVFVELALEQSEIAAVEFDPEAFALQVFQPAGSQVSPPVTLDPAADGGFAEVKAGFLALDPLEAEASCSPST